MIVEGYSRRFPSEALPSCGGKSIALDMLDSVNLAFALSCGSPLLIHQRTILHGTMQLLDRSHAYILQGLSETHVQMGKVHVQRPLVGNEARHTLLHLDPGLAVHQVACAATLLHGLLGAHPSVLLHAHAIAVEPFARSFMGACQHASHHHTACSERERLHNMPGGTDASVGDDGDVKPSSEPRDLIDGHSLRSPARHHLLSRADASNTHSNSKSITTSLDQVRCLTTSNHIPSNHFDVRIVLLDVTDHVSLVG
mmetsp:Transcript_49697/g.155518  ORF Transcript_49697/g.155518 Transcript_49697/m.155518 type:complete len:254 (-) Transcript_49697:1142-1903(-)